MRFKLDENLTPRAATFLREAGHDVMTVVDERLGGADDAAVFAACVAERRILITLDHDFGNVVRFPPATSPGVAVVELPPGKSPVAMMSALEALLAGLKKDRLDGSLWIIEPGRIRIHEREDLGDGG